MMRFAMIAVLMATLAAAAAVTAPRSARAVLPDERLEDPALEARARDISSELRCVVCQNQSIDDSNAEIARDLRLLVRERLVAGDSDGEVVDFVVARYGDYVRLRPPFQDNTLALWLGPPIMAVVIATLAVMYFRRYQHLRGERSGPDPLSPQDRAELDALVERIHANAPPPKPKSAFRAELDNPRPVPPPPPDEVPEDSPTRPDDAAGNGRRDTTRA